MDQEDLISSIESGPAAEETTEQPVMQEEEVSVDYTPEQEQPQTQPARVQKPVKKRSLTQLLSIISYFVLGGMFIFIIIFGYLMGQ